MSQNFFKLLPAISVITFAIVLRLLPHPPNFAPIAAMALFGGVYLDKKYALMVPLLAMFVSDLYLGFHESMLLVYGSFLLTGLIGIWVRKHTNVRNIILSSLASSILFFVLTNFNYWYAESLYPKTFEGLISSYTNALPFFRNTVLGDLFYTGLFFGSYELILSQFKIQKLKVKSTSKK